MKLFGYTLDWTDYLITITAAVLTGDKLFVVANLPVYVYVIPAAVFVIAKFFRVGSYLFGSYENFRRFLLYFSIAGVSGYASYSYFIVGGDVGEMRAYVSIAGFFLTIIVYEVAEHILSGDIRRMTAEEAIAASEKSRSSLHTGEMPGTISKYTGDIVM